jgi:histidyl-tRNA synthetase
LWKQSSELVEFFAAVETLGAAEFVEFNPVVIRGLDYYTGTVFEARDTRGDFRAILGGGRYDNLVADVGGGRMPGVGFAMGDVVMGLVLTKFGKYPSLETAPAKVLVTMFSKEEADLSMKIARELREDGIATEWYPAPDRLPKQLKYAAAQGMRLAVILGPDEVNQGTVIIKDLILREQSSVPMKDLVQEVRSRLAAASAG